MLETIREYAGGDAGRSVARRTTIADRHAEAMLDPRRAGRAAAGRLRTNGSGSIDSSVNTTTCAPRSIGRSRNPIRPRRPPGLRALAVLAAARLPQRGESALRAARGAGLGARAILQARFAEAFGGIAYWQSDQRTATRLYDDALRLWRELGEKREIANALYNRAYADMIEVMEGRVVAGQETRDVAAAGRGACHLSRHRRRGGEGNILWALGSLHFFTANAGIAESLVPPVPRAPPEGGRSDDGGVVPAHARPLACRPAPVRRGHRGDPARSARFPRGG